MALLDKKNVERILCAFSRAPLFYTTMNAKEVEYMFDISSVNIFCNGRLRTICVDRITDNCFKVYTKKWEK